MGRTEERPAVETGWAKLEQGRWTDARRLFESALAAEESPEALEGLSWAAWWLDDGDVVFETRERAYRVYRRRKEPAAAARMATWLASDELDFHGATAVARGWLLRARRLLAPLPEGPDHGWLAFHEGYLAHASGDVVAARTLAASTATLGREHGVVDLEMLGLALEGAALVSSSQVDEGIACLDEATTMALEGDATIPIASAWTCCFLVTACLKVGDLERAVEWCDRIARFADRYGSRYMLAFCRAEYGSVDLARGRWSEAQTMLEAAVDDFSKSRPAWVGAPLAELAELRRRQGRRDEAAELLDRAGPSRAAQLCRARLAIDRGDTLQAVELLELLLRRIPDGSRLDRAPVLELLARARTSRGDLDLAAEACEGLRTIAESVRTPAPRAGLDLAAGRLAAARGDRDGARRLLEDAVDRYEQAGAPYEAAEARMELASTLAELGRSEAAEREEAAALGSLAALCTGRSDAQQLGATPDELPLARLTRRERDVVLLLAEGMTNRQIATELVISEHTVHRHVTNILRKLDAPSRTAAAAKVARAGALGDAR